MPVPTSGDAPSAIGGKHYEHSYEGDQRHLREVFRDNRKADLFNEVRDAYTGLYAAETKGDEDQVFATKQRIDQLYHPNPPLLEPILAQSLFANTAFPALEPQTRTTRALERIARQLEHEDHVGFHPVYELDTFTPAQRAIAAERGIRIPRPPVRVEPNFPGQVYPGERPGEQIEYPGAYARGREIEGALPVEQPLPPIEEKYPQSRRNFPTENRHYKGSLGPKRLPSIKRGPNPFASVAHEEELPEESKTAPTKAKRSRHLRSKTIARSRKHKRVTLPRTRARSARKQSEPHTSALDLPESKHETEKRRSRAITVMNKEPTKQDIIELLSERRVPFNPRWTKDHLLQLLRTRFPNPEDRHGVGFRVKKIYGRGISGAAVTNRRTILKGEIEAGNSNPILRRELASMRR